MIQVYQESIPFSNNRIDAPVSTGNRFTNPIIMPFALNTTIGTNVFETVIYIKNTDINDYYKDVVVALMTENEYADGTVDSTGQLFTNENTGVVLFGLNDVTGAPTSLAFPYSGPQPTVKAIPSQYKGNYQPLVNDQQLEVKFSYGYDEISAAEWETLNSILIIPMIGNSTTPDISYIPIRIRIKVKENNIAFTNRSYFLDISYGTKGDVEGQF